MVRWGIIGAGGIAEKRAIPALLLNKTCVVEGIMRTDPLKLAEMQQRFNIPHGFLSVDELLKHPHIDAVYIASPIHVHAEQAIQCANAGKMVFIEKPVGMNKQEVEAIRAACRSNGVFFSGALMMRYHELHERMRELVASGAIGTPVAARMDFHFKYPEQQGSWRQIKRLGGGGVMMDLGPHCLDMLQYVSGRNITKVQAAFMNTQTYAYEVEDSATVLLELEGGIHAVVSVHFNIPEDVSKTRLEVFGTEGWMHAEGTLGQVEAGKLHYKHATGGQVQAYELHQTATDEHPPEYALYMKEFAQFEVFMKNPHCWESLMEEQIMLQSWIDDSYRAAFDELPGK